MKKLQKIPLYGVFFLLTYFYVFFLFSIILAHLTDILLYFNTSTDKIIVQRLKASERIEQNRPNVVECNLSSIIISI